jgi:GNAT superfamily N-acetyltransferase
MRDLYRQEMDCQIRYDSHLGRGLADPYLLFLDGRVAGYGGVLNRYDAGRLTEFYVLPHARARRLPLFRALLAASGATQIAAQTNDPTGLLLMLYDCGRNIVSDSILFHDAERTGLPCPAGVFRHADSADCGPNPHDPPPQWVIEEDGVVVAAGGFLTHYNPPYADIFMSVAASERRRGFGSYLVQEIKRMCYEAGRRPAARCNPDNVASRRTLEKAGLLPCARVLVGDVAPL